MAAIATQPTADDIIRSIAELEPQEFELVVDRVEALKARREGSEDLSQAALLEKILEAPDSGSNTRYQELRSKQNDGEPLDSSELDELTSLIDWSEWDRVRRVRALIELADLQGKSIEQLKDELGLGWGKIE